MEQQPRDLIPRTLLIVDDDEINRGILAHIFAGQYAIREAENGREGLQIIENAGASLCAVLLDVVMPEMDGLAVLRALQPTGALQRLPVFLITAEARDEVMREAYALGVMDVISKPVVPYVVQRRVQSVVELFDARKRLSRTVEQQQSELVRRARQIVDLNMGMIEALSTAIEFRDGESGGACPPHPRHHGAAALPHRHGRRLVRGGDRADRAGLHHARCGQDRHSLTRSSTNPAGSPPRNTRS